MISSDPIVPGAAALAEAKAYLRANTAGEDALIGRLLGTALELCEQFTGQVLLARGFAETLPVGLAWTRLGRRPVRAITVADALIDGSAAALPAGAYLTDIDAAGCGWVRVLDAGGARTIRIGFAAGLVASWDELPEALAQGVLRLTGHLHGNRSGTGDGAPPAAVAALWRPYRYLRLV